MHLSRHSMIRTSRRKVKMTKKKMEEYTLAWRKHNKSMKRANLHSMVYGTVQEYIDYVYGKKTRKAEFKPLEVSYPVAYEMNNTKKYPSLDGSSFDTSKKENARYTGDKLVGIGVMHKSNLVPIFKGDDAKDLARMRRG